MSQIERRYLVTRLADGFPNWSRQPYEIIEQGYWDSPEHDILRIRIIESPGGGGSEGEAMRKSGAGLVRNSKRRKLSCEEGRWWIDHCPYTLRKNRFRVDGWKLDIFEGTLQGIIIAEKELRHADEEIVFPPWILEAKEITDQVNNLHLAKIARVIGEGGDPVAMVGAAARRIPRIVLTGGPCSGKSTVMRALRERLGHRLHCLPEVASILISQADILPSRGGAPGLRSFQQAIYATQKTFEETARVQAAVTGKEAFLSDRGTLDCVPYLKGGFREFEEICNTDAEIESLRYDLVIKLDLPPRAVYEANMASNPARSEDYDQARALDTLVTLAWSYARELRRVKSTGTIEKKIEAVTAIIEEFLPGI